MEKRYGNPEYHKYLKEVIKRSEDIYVCENCFDTKERKIKKKDIIRMPKRAFLFRECDNCIKNKEGICTECSVGDKIGIWDYDEIPFTHLCIYGRTDVYGKVISMSELCCPVCKKPIHRVIGENIIISIIGSRDSGKSHYIGVLIHEMLNKLAQQFEWCIVPEENTMRLYENNFEQLYTTNQILNLTSKNYDGYYDPYIFYVTDKKGKTFTITIFDTAGEDFESDDLMENSAKHAFHASGIIFLVDPLKILNVYTALDQEIIRNSSSVSAGRAFQNDAILSILSNSLRRHYNIKETKKITVPMGIVIPKLDVIAKDLPGYYACLFPSSYGKKQGIAIGESRRINTEIRKWMLGLNDGAINSFIAQLEMNYAKYSYFGVSALGMRNAPDENGVFASPRPHRVEDPILWILKEKGIVAEKK